MPRGKIYSRDVESSRLGFGYGELGKRQLKKKSEII
jgi:hypothetical protein